MYDTDNDGKVTLEEYLGMLREKLVSNGNDFSEYQVSFDHGSIISNKYAINQGCRSLLTYKLEYLAAVLRDSAVVRTRPRAIPLAMITIRKSIDEFPLTSYMGMVLRYKITTSRGSRVWRKV